MKQETTADPDAAKHPEPRTVPRCAHVSPSGRRCASSVYDQRSSRCFRHNTLQKRTDDADHSAALTRDADAFQSRQGIQRSLNELYVLLAQNRIAPRRAAVLAFIANMMLRIVDAEAREEPSVIFDIQPPSRLAPDDQS